MYLVHWIILYVVFELLGHKLPFWALIVLVITVSLLAAEIMARFVEYPCINLGKRLLGAGKAEKRMGML